MKKLLTLIGALALTTTATATIVSCGGPDDTGENDVKEPNLERFVQKDLSDLFSGEISLIFNNEAEDFFELDSFGEIGFWFVMIPVPEAAQIFEGKKINFETDGSDEKIEGVIDCTKLKNVGPKDDIAFFNSLRTEFDDHTKTTTIYSANQTITIKYEE